jgi:hypothetical protein
MLPLTGTAAETVAEAGDKSLTVKEAGTSTSAPKIHPHEWVLSIKMTVLIRVALKQPLVVQKQRQVAIRKQARPKKPATAKNPAAATEKQAASAKKQGATPTANYKKRKNTSS